MHTLLMPTRIGLTTSGQIANTPLMNHLLMPTPIGPTSEVIAAH